MWNLTPIDCCKCNKCLLKEPVIEKKVFDNHIPKLNILCAGTNWSSLNGCGQAHLDISKILQIQEPLISQGWTELWKQLSCALNVGRHPLKQQVDCKSWVIVSGMRKGHQFDQGYGIDGFTTSFDRNLKFLFGFIFWCNF